MGDDLDALDKAYERAEAAFLSAVRSDEPREALANAATAVSVATGAWNGEAYRLLRSSRGDELAALDLLTERTEVQSELWTDLASAFTVRA